MSEGCTGLWGVRVVAVDHRARTARPVQGQDDVVSFFEDLPQPPEPDEDGLIEGVQPPWLGAPDHVMGGVVPLAARILCTEHVFAGLASVVAYPTGISLELVLGVRREAMSRQRWLEVQTSVHDDSYRQHAGTAAASTDGLRLGVELADGRHTSTLDRGGWGEGTVPEPPVLVENGGRGSGGLRWLERSVRLWLWPLPEGESLSLVLQWPALDVPLTTYRLELGPVRRAAEQARPYWP